MIKRIVMTLALMLAIATGAQASENTYFQLSFQAVETLKLKLQGDADYRIVLRDSENIDTSADYKLSTLSGKVCKNNPGSLEFRCQGINPLTEKFVLSYESSSKFDLLWSPDNSVYVYNREGFSAFGAVEYGFYNHGYYTAGTRFVGDTIEWIEDTYAYETITIGINYNEHTGKQTEIFFSEIQHTLQKKGLIGYVNGVYLIKTDNTGCRQADMQFNKFMFDCGSPIYAGEMERLLIKTDARFASEIKYAIFGNSEIVKSQAYSVESEPVVVPAEYPSTFFWIEPVDVYMTLLENRYDTVQKLKPTSFTLRAADLIRSKTGDSIAFVELEEFAMPGGIKTISHDVALICGPSAESVEFREFVQKNIYAISDWNQLDIAMSNGKCQLEVRHNVLAPVEYLADPKSLANKLAAQNKAVEFTAFMLNGDTVSVSSEYKIYMN